MDVQLVAAPKIDTCTWEFVAYHPSPLEVKWQEDIESIQTRVCAATAELPAADVSLWLDYATAAATPLLNSSLCDALPPAPRTFHDRNVLDVMSSFEYGLKCADKYF